MITLISGLPGSGKSSLIVLYALQNMVGAAAKRALKLSNMLTSNYINGGLDWLTEQCEHLVYSDNPISTKRGSLVSRHINGFYLGLPNKFYPTHIIPSYSTIFLDEAQRYYNSRERGLADHVSRFYELHRHNNLNIYLCAQRPGLIDKNIRELAQEVIYCVGCSEVTDYGFVTGFKWDILHYDNAQKLISDIDSGNFSGKKETITFSGNIGKHYDDKFFKHLFVDTERRADYSNLYASSGAYHLSAIDEFKKKYTFEVPNGYYKTNKRSA